MSTITTTEFLTVYEWTQRFSKYPLHRAAEFGNLKAVRSLLEAGHSPNESNYDCLTPLHEACVRGHVECARVLIEYGAQVNASCIEGSTPLCDACAAGSAETVCLLMKHGAVVNPPLVLTTPLHEAALRGDVECVQLLIKAGARLDAMDCHFGTPLHAATFMQNTLCVKALLLAGANVNATKIHQTPLHLAAVNDFSDAGKLLLQFGANPFATDNQGRTPRELLPNSMGTFYEQLKAWENSTRSLQDLCRYRIRSRIGSSRLHQTKLLGLPTSILAFLEHTYD
ncbi:uncharacterized protein LOC143242062 isoform X1 [Tachypleus tridentatus]|uniref:uncharacterized protein LOC143242062 isoform X1 n=1 Tax=Tachypleus tridentatus TaxID=6853 RepID=UPI003FD2FE40